MDIASDQPVLAPLRRAELDGYLLKILERELGLTLHGVRIGSSRDDSMRELTEVAASLYEERVLTELIQNAYDGSSGTHEAEILVRINLQVGDHGTVYVANNGAGFTEEDVDAIVNPALSSKRPGRSIGHKGLGFRGVELISDYPQVYSMDGPGRQGARWFDGFCFSFARPEDERACLERLKAGDLLDQVVGKTHRLQLPVPIPEQQPLEILRFANKGFTTVVCLPLRDEAAARRAVEEWQSLFNQTAPLVLFLDRVTALSLECIQADGMVERRAMTRQHKRVAGYAQSPLLLEQVVVDRHRYLLARAEVDKTRFLAAVERAIEDGYPLKKWREWEGQPEVRFAIPFSTEPRQGKYYTFLPTNKDAPFCGFLDAPFFPDADRRDVHLRNPLNSMLLDAVAETCARLSLSFAEQDERTSELANAALDAVSWSTERERLFAGFHSHGIDREDIPVPIARRRETRPRWSTLKAVFTWEDEDFSAIRGDWLARVCEVPVLRRGIGEKRLTALTNFAKAANVSLQPPPSNWKTWAPKLATDLLKHKKPKRVWEEFYADLSKIAVALPHLRGTYIFLSSEGSIVAANSPQSPNTATEQPELFIVPTSGERKRQKRNLGETGLFPPRSLTRKMIFVDPTLRWRSDVISAFVKAGLADEYNLPQVVARLGRLVGRKPPRARVLAALGWAFSVWKSHRAEVEESLKRANLLVPIRGANISASQALFGEGWRNTIGNALAELCSTSAEKSREIRQLCERILPSWEEWLLKDQGTAIEWTQFLRVLSVRDGFVPLYQQVSMEQWQWSPMLYSAGPSIPVERLTGPTWRKEIQGKSQQSFRYQSGTYSTAETLVWLPGQTDFDELPAGGKLAYAQLIIHFLDENQERFLTTRLTRAGGNYDCVEWPSPILAFLRREQWIPIQADGDVSWGTPGESWYAYRSEYLPHFVRRIDRVVRDSIDSSKPLSQIMASKLGLRIWSSPETSAERIAFLGKCLAEGIGEAERDAFRKAYREAWQDWHELGPDRASLTGGLIIPVEIAGRLTPLPDTDTGDGNSGDERVVYVSDDSNPTRHQLVAALGKPVFSAPANMAQTCADALASVRHNEFTLLTDAQLQVEVDGEVFTPSGEAEPLVAAGREWLAEISALVLELRTELTNRNTDRARRGLFQSLKRIRVKFVGMIQVTLGSTRGALPPSLQHVLPIPHPEYPTLLVEGADALSWRLLASMATGLALVIEQPSLAQPFKLAFLEIARREFADVFERPDDETVALALEQPVQRVRELYRSLRSTSQHLLDVLMPVVYLKFGSTVAAELQKQSDLLLDEADVVRWVGSHAPVSPEDAIALVNTCRDSQSLDDVRRAFAFDLPTFNTALSSLGSPWQPLRFEERLKRSFKDRIDENRSDIQQRIRDAYFDNYDNCQALDTYIIDLTIDWITFPQEWVDLYAELSDQVIDTFVNEKISDRLPSSASEGGESLEAIRRKNRAELVRSADAYRRVVRAWCAKDQDARIIPKCWLETTEQLAREAVASGYLDFRMLTGDSLISILARAKLWPVGMPPSVSLSLVGLSDEDLKAEEKQEEQRRQAILKAKRSVTFGSVDVDGGEDGCLEKVASALQAVFASEGFRNRSGVANLEAFRSRSR
jgi:hypothetical protein